MRNQLAYLFVCCLLLCFASGCDRYKCNNYGKVTNETYYIDTELKNYFFKPGSYWVYETPALPYADSVFVTSYEHYFDRSYGLDPDCGFTAEENYVVKCKQILGGTASNNFEWSFSVNSIYQKMMIYYVNRGSGPGFAGVSEICVDTNIVVGGENYAFVKVFRYDSIVTGEPGQIVIDEFEYTTEYYWCPGYGIVKKVEYGTPQGIREWNLKRKYLIL